MTDKNKQYHKGDPVPEGMEVVTRSTAWPYYGAAAVFLIWGLFLPMKSWATLIIAVLLAAAAFVLLQLFGPKDYHLEQTPEALAKTSSEEANAAINAGRRLLAEMRAVNKDIPDEGITEKMNRLDKVGTAIFNHLEEHPEKVKETRRFLNYYLPTTLNLLKQYRELRASGVEGENIRNASKGVEGILDKLIQGFEKQYDNLFSTEALDMSADISVLESMLKSEGLDGDDFKAAGKKETTMDDDLNSDDPYKIVLK